MIYAGTRRFIVLRGCCVFGRLRVRGHPAWSKSIGAFFPTAFAHVMSPCHILLILTTFQTLHEQKDDDSLKAQVMASIF